MARRFREAGVPADVRPVRPTRLEAGVARAAAQGTPIIGIAGGDGTIRTGAEILAGSETVLAPLPCGTFNHFARGLGLEDMAGAVRAIAGRGSVRVPLGIVDDRVFLNTATFGLYAGIVDRRDRWRRWMGKWGAAAVATVFSLSRLRQVAVVLDADGVRLHRTTALVWVGAGRGSFPFSHEGRLRDPNPVLEVVVVRANRGVDASALVGRLIWRLLRGKPPHEDRGLEVFHTRRLLIHGSGSLGVTLDGELYAYDPPIFISIQRDALRVASPLRDG